MGWNDDEHSYPLCRRDISLFLTLSDLGGLCCVRSSYRWTLCELTRSVMQLCGLQIPAFFFPSVCVRKIQDHFLEGNISILQYIMDMLFFFSLSRPLIRSLGMSFQIFPVVSVVCVNLHIWPTRESLTNTFFNCAQPMYPVYKVPYTCRAEPPQPKENEKYVLLTKITLGHVRLSLHKWKMYF